MKTLQRLKQRELEEHNTQLNKSVRIFYLIGGLSILNSIIMLSQGGISFIAGLGVTQFIDVILAELIKAGASNSILYIGLAINLIISLLVCYVGYAGKKGKKKIYTIGMILYGLDGLLFLAIGLIPPFAFHVGAMYFIIKSLKKLKRVKELESELATDSEQGLEGNPKIDGNFEPEPQS